MLTELKKRVLIFDGAMGTNVQNAGVPQKDYNGAEGNTEILVLTRPDVIYQIHRQFIEAGCDAIETNTFGANGVVQAEYDLADKVYELNLKAVEIARQAAREVGSRAHPVYVIGSVGPGTKLPTLGHISFDALYNAYRPQMEALVDAEVDAILIETCQDLLQAKTAILCAKDVLKEKQKKIPIFCQITVETTGTMLIGTETLAAINALSPLGIADLGLNCATGPDPMFDHVRTLCRHFPGFVSILPNAGIPEVKSSGTVYPLTPEQLASAHERFVHDFGVNIIGGCCGTTPLHLKAVAQKLWGKACKTRQVEILKGATSCFQFVSFQQDPAPLLIGERTNANGSRKFKTLLEKEDFEGMIQMAKDQEAEGAHMIDVCLALVGRDEPGDMARFTPFLAQQVTVPISIDSTDWRAIETALKALGGRCLINSINLEDGGEKLHRVTQLAKRYGAALVALTIDEQGMAKTVERKVAIARRIFEIVHSRYGVEAHELFFDPLTFTLGSGDEEFRKAGIHTLEAIQQIKKEIPGCFTVLGVSNISFGLNSEARKILNSVFLHEAVKAGLDAAIVHAGKIVPMAQIEKEHLALMLDLIYDRRREGYDPLHKILEVFERKKSTSKRLTEELSLEERLKQRIIKGNSQGIEKDLEEALKHYDPLKIINTFLIEGMQVVGDLFGKGELQLPFVLQSAEVMKKAVAYLEPFMEKKEAKTKGKIVLATVKGDVHDIGKNLVDIILSNNGYQVFNLGIKCELSKMLEAAEKYGADAIGMSGLLVKSVAVMKENLEEMNRQRKLFPVILGGAALNRHYVEKDLRALYQGKVFYARDAFEGMQALEKIAKGEVDYAPSPRPAPKELLSKARKEGKGKPFQKKISPSPVPEIPFYGCKILDNIALSQVIPYINKIALFRGQWQFKQGKMSFNAYQKMIKEKVEPIFQRVADKAKAILKPKAIIGFFYCTKEGDELIILEKDKRKERLRFKFPRQKVPPYLCLTDFIRDPTEGIDNIAISAVTVGDQATREASRLFEQGAFQEYLFWHGFSVEAAEALAEFVHKEVRKLWKIDGADAKEPEKIIKGNYQGCRYSFGYPACPELEDQKKLFELIHPVEIGLTLTESYQLVPEQSTTALIFHHKDARYFNP